MPRFIRHATVACCILIQMTTPKTPPSVQLPRPTLRHRQQVLREEGRTAVRERVEIAPP